MKIMKNLGNVETTSQEYRKMGSEIMKHGKRWSGTMNLLERGQRRPQK